MKILFIVMHRMDRSPGQRFRFEQYLPYLKSHGFDYEVSYIINEKDDAFFYKPGNILRKAGVGLKSIKKRFSDLQKAKKADIVFIYREALFLGSTWFERKMQKTTAKMIYDFDDAIWIQDMSQANRLFSFLKNPNKTPELISLADKVFAGNRYLANYALQFNSEVSIIPTTIDTENLHNRRKVHEEKSTVTIGWTGSGTTLKYVKALYPVFDKIYEKHRIEVLVICDLAPEEGPSCLTYLPWNLATEIDDLIKIDIGVMPLPDDKWANGKCGFKILQYMGLGIPAIASPVGVNKDIIEDGKNGFLANSLEEWEDKLIHLIEDVELRKEIGNNGYQTVERHYSVNSVKEKYVEEFQALCKDKV